jgi:hypothetical protein
VISISHVLEHLSDPEQMLNNIYNRMKPGGLSLIEVPNDHLKQLGNPSRKSGLPHLWFYSLAGLKKLLQASRFQLLRSAELGVRPNAQKVSIAKRAIRSLRIHLKGSLALLNDPDWYTEGKDRSEIRVLARKPM